MTVPVDESTVREFIEIINGHAAALARNVGRPGVLQLTRLNSHDEKMVPTRFRIDDVEAMVRAAISDGEALFNVYIEARTVRADLRGVARGSLNDTELVFGLVIDADHDKARDGAVTVRPSLVVETSRGNFHYWYLFDRPVAAQQAKLIGDAVRACAGADHDTGTVTQPYRVAGTPNFPSKAKQARGRTAVEPTRLIENTGRLWDPDELLAAHTTGAAAPNATARRSPAATAESHAIDETSLPESLVKAIREGGASKGLGAKGDKSGSGLFHHVVGELKKRRWAVDAIVALLEKYPNGVAAKYAGRLAEEALRSYGKVENNGAAPVAPAVGGAGGASGGGSGGGSAPTPGSAAGAGAGPHVLPTIQLRAGQLPRAVEETERAMLAAGIEAFARAGTLVFPIIETLGAAGGHKTESVQLREFTSDSFTEPVCESAIFQRYDMKRKAWVEIDPPQQLVRMVLSRERRWAFPRISGVITTPTLRADGSLLATPGYDPRTELYLRSSVQLRPIPQRPTKEEARVALLVLKDLFVEFSFKRKAPALDLSVALSGLFTALLRGSLPTSPVYLVRAHTPGAGKSYLVDVIAEVATGRLCPVITASRSSEETEKRLGSVLLSGSVIVSLDNVAHDLDGELLCQIGERPVVRIRILGRSEMPDCECHTAVFATGNNVSFKGDMVRRGLMCELEALDERPELREFKCDALNEAPANRAQYVGAALTIVRAYLAAGAPRVCGPFGSYAAWSTMVRSPLVWLGEPDPVASMEEIREEDVELSNIREFFGLWPSYLLIDTPYVTARIIEIAGEQRPNNFNSLDLKLLLLRVAAMRGRESEVSPDRLGWWLRRISGRVVGQRRLIKEHNRASNAASFRLVKTP
jgi:hypothetical protein